MINTSSLNKILLSLDRKLVVAGKGPVHLLVGGAGALVGAYGYFDSTNDVDAISIKGDLEQIKKEILDISREFRLPQDWINPHFSSFTIYLPSDYRIRCQQIFSGDALKAEALGPEDLIIMKLMAGRRKDRSHIQFLLSKGGVDLSVVEERLIELEKLYPDLSKRALKLFDEILGEGQ